ncbi:hypothetical protein SAMN05444004_101101 [Jannaschia faecimaris]|uniref:Uncharacterized protein n=1 Tax=Jannaschia faecimaris TaxID=1244108 RepID=A0A1H3ITI2_9RHOB|nr:hypothetical protein SAMN05444004_101101 [Jannaschia faecimaris]
MTSGRAVSVKAALKAALDLSEPCQAGRGDPGAGTLTTFPAASRARRLGMKIGRPLANPFHKFRKSRVGPQCFGRIPQTGQIRLGRGGVDLVMADLMQQNGWAPLSAA